MAPQTMIKLLTRPGIVPVIRLESGDKLPELLEALRRGGIRAAELTMTMPNAPALLRENRARFGNSLALGMGTVTNRQAALTALAAGAQFLVSPFPVFEALEEAKRNGVPMITGAFSPGEVFSAHRLGADFVKVFPLNVLGLNYLKDLKGPLPQVKFFPTGGITQEQIPELFRLGVAGCGVGSALVKPELIREEKWEELTALAREFVERSQRP